MSQSGNGPQVDGRDRRGGPARDRDRRGRFTRARHRDQLTGEQRTPGHAPGRTTEELVEADLAATDGRLRRLIGAPPA